MAFAMLSQFFKDITKCCPCHDFWLDLRHVTKCCACHEKQNAWAESAAPATRKQHADLDTPPKYCACHAKRKNDLPSCEFEAPKRAFRARLPRVFARLKLRIDDFMRVFLIKLFSQSSKKVLLFARLPQVFKAVTKCCACHDF